MKKLISLILTMALICSLASVAFAFSYVAELNGDPFNSVDAALIAAEEGDTVYVIKDSAEPVSVSGKYGVTLDLNGHRIGSLTIDSAVITIKDSDPLKTGMIYDETYGEPALTITESSVIVESGRFASDSGTVVYLRNGLLTVYSGFFSGAFDVKDAAVIIYRGYFDSLTAAQYVYTDCSFSENDDVKTKDQYPYVVFIPGDEATDDIIELPIVGPFLDDDESGFRCPACKVFDGFYNGDYGTAITSIGFVSLIFNVIHKMIHNVYKIVNSTTSISKDTITLPDLTTQ